MATANALQLEFAWATPVLSRFNYDAMPSLNSNLSIVVLWRFCCYAVTSTFDLWPWTFTRITYDVMKLYQIWTQLINPPRRSYCDFNVWPNDLALNVVWRVALGSETVFTKFNLRQLICAFFWCWYVIHAVILTFDALTLKVVVTSSVTWSQSVRNLSEIEQSAAELLMISRVFAHVVSRCNLDLRPLDLELLRHFDYHVFKLCIKIWEKSNNPRLSC